MASEDEHALADGHVPLSDGIVGTSTDNVNLFDEQTRDVLLMTGQDSNAITSFGFRCPHSNRPILAAYRTVVVEFYE